MKDKTSIKWLYKIIKKQIPKIVFLSASNAILALLGIGIVLIGKRIVDVAVGIAKHTISGYDKLIFWGILMFFAIFARMLVRIFNQSLYVKAQANMEMGIRRKMFSSIMCKKYSEISKYHSGNLMNRLTSDISIVSNGMVSLVPDTTFIIFQLAGAFVVLILFDWKFALIFLFAGVIVVAIISYFRKKLKDLHKLVQETDGKSRSFFQEAIESLLVVKTFGVENEMEERGKGLLITNFDAKMKRRKVSIYANAGFNFVFNVGYLYGLIWCSYKLCQGTMTYGTLTAVLQLIGQIQGPFANFTSIFPQLFGIMASAERIMEIENMTPEKVEQLSYDCEELYDRLDSIEFKDIQFSYGREDVIKGGSARINKGEIVVIKGISGIGKSTLLKMLLGVFSPDKGEITLNFSDGKNIKADPYTRDMFSYVPQGNYLFSGTLRDNLMLVNKDATDDEINMALKLADCNGFMKDFPEGLDTVIGEKGMGLSEGQAQRIAIARAILCKSPVILLDEATSALDAKTEEQVLGNIKSLKNRTCVLITHKEAADRVMDRQIIIENKYISDIEITA